MMIMLPSLPTGRKNRADKFIDIIAEHSLLQFNTSPTCNSHVLDLVLSNVTGIVTQPTYSAVASDHTALECSVVCIPKKNPPIADRYVFNYRRADFDHLKTQLSLIPWSAQLSSDNVNIAV